MKLILKTDWTWETNFLGKSQSNILYKAGHIFECDTDELFEINQPTGGSILLTKDQMIQFDFIEEITERQNDFEIIIEEVPEDDDVLVRNWRIQLDVKTTRKKLKEVQRIIEEYVKPIL
jgi:hypothetical protein